MNNQLLESAFAAHRATIMKNVLVKPIEGTVLDEVMQQCPVFYKDTDAAVSKAITAEDYTEVQTTVANVSEHLSGYQDQYDSSVRTAVEAKAKVVSEIVLAHLNFVKNVANPICKDFITSYNDLTHEPIDPVSDFNMVKVKANPVLSNSSWLATLTQEYDNAAGEKKGYPTGYFPIPVMTFSQVCEAIVRYFGENGADILEYIQSLGSDSIMNYLADAFNWPKTESKVPLANPRDGDTVMFLLASALYDNPVQGTEHTLGNFNDRMKSYIIACGYVLCKYHAKEYMNQIANQQVLLRVNGNNVFINETTYDAFIKDGGDDLRLLGFVVSKEHPAISTIKELKEKVGIYEAAWSKYVLNKKNEYDVKASNRARQVYLFLAEKVIKDNSSAIEQFCKDTGIEVDKLIASYYENVKINQNRYPEHMLSEPQRMAMELMGYLFPGSSVKNIYSISLDVEMLNPDYTPQEVWQITSYRYICQFYFDQICVYRK